MKGGLLVLAALSLVLLNCQEPEPEGNLDIVFFDVSNGGAVLIRTPDQRTCLIDGGPTYAGANEICPVLDSLGITELDYCIATNFTEGRVGGLDEVLRHLGQKAGATQRCYGRDSTFNSPAFLEYRTAAGDRYARMWLGEVVEIGDVTLWCLALNGRVLGQKSKEPEVEKDRSIALLVSYFDFDLLITSDLAGNPEGDRINLGSRLAEVADEVEVLAVGNSGSEAAVNFGMVQQVNPVVSVVTVGPDDSTLPSQMTLNRLTSRHRKVYQSSRTGSATLPRRNGRVVGGNIWVTVGEGFYTVAGDTFRAYR